VTAKAVWPAVKTRQPPNSEEMERTSMARTPLLRGVTVFLIRE
jgi:hypothetical protein